MLGLSIFRLGSCSWICPKESTSPYAHARSAYLLGLCRFESLCLNIFAIKFSWKKKQERYRYDVKEGFEPLPSEAGERPPFFSQPLTVNIARKTVKELERAMLLGFQMPFKCNMSLSLIKHMLHKEAETSTEPIPSPATSGEWKVPLPIILST